MMLHINMCGDTMVDKLQANDGQVNRLLKWMIVKELLNNLDGGLTG